MSSTRRVGWLEVCTDESGEDEDLPPNSRRFRIVEEIIHLALRVLETPKGRESLADIATRIITTFDRADKRVPHLFKGKVDRDMRQCIDDFLGKMRSNFPVIYLIKMSAEGAAIRRDWGKNMAKYDPKAAVQFLLNRVIINNMIYAEQQPDTIAGDAVNLFKFQMITTVGLQI